jgi:repressor LexA
MVKPARLEELTARQREVLEFIAREIARTGISPTVREIGKAMGINSTNGVKDHLRALERHGVLSHQPGKVRTLKVLVAPPGMKKRCVCSEALALLEAGEVAAARELLASAVVGDGGGHTWTVGMSVDERKRAQRIREKTLT